MAVAIAKQLNKKVGRASRYAFPGRAGERVEFGGLNRRIMWIRQRFLHGFQPFSDCLIFRLWVIVTA